MSGMPDKKKVQVLLANEQALQACQARMDMMGTGTTTGIVLRVGRSRGTGNSRRQTDTALRGSTDTFPEYQLQLVPRLYRAVTRCRLP
jgi:hypothetical protein